MSVKSVLITTLTLLLTFNYLKNVKAQDTFGPVCDDVTVTCVPSATPVDSPTPTQTPPPVDTPTPTDTPPPTPTALPRAGITDGINRLLLVALTLILIGTISHLALSSKKS